MRDIIYPGQQLTEHQRRSHNTYKENDAIYSSVLGLYDDQHGSIAALEGVWKPRQGDIVVGMVTDARPERHVYMVDICYFGRAIIVEDRHSSNEYKVGDIVEAEVGSIEHKRNIVLQMPKVLNEGSVMLIKPTKVPRVIGKSNTMVKQIAELTGCSISVGTNGVIWLKGGDIAAAKMAILTIEKHAHVSGLTDRIKEMLVNK